MAPCIVCGTVAKKAAAERASAASAAAARSGPPSALQPAVREFVDLIFSERMMKQQLESLSIDLDKMPLGSITDRQAQRGYATLTEIA